MKEDASGPRTESASHMENIKVRISEGTTPLPQFISFNQRSQSVEKLDIFEFSVYPQKSALGRAAGLHGVDMAPGKVCSGGSRGQAGRPQTCG